MWDGFDIRPETRAAKPSSPILQSSSLQREGEKCLNTQIYPYMSWCRASHKCWNRTDFFHNAPFKIIFVVFDNKTHSSFSSSHCGCFRRSNSLFTPESPGSFLLRLSSLRCDGFDFRPDTRAAKPFLAMLQYSSLQRERGKTLHMVLWYGTLAVFKNNITNCSFSSLQRGSFSRSERSFTPESPGSLLLRSSSLRWEGFDISAKARAAQPSSPILQSYSLQREDTISVCVCAYMWPWTTKPVLSITGIFAAIANNTGASQ